MERHAPQFGLVSGLRRAKRKAIAFQIKTKPGIRSVYKEYQANFVKAFCGGHLN